MKNQLRSSLQEVSEPLHFEIIFVFITETTKKPVFVQTGSSRSYWPNLYFDVSQIIITIVQNEEWTVIKHLQACSRNKTRRLRKNAQDLLS